LLVIPCLQINFVGSKLVEHPQTQAYKYIIQDSIIIRNITKTVQDGNTDNIPEEAKVKVYSVLSLGCTYVNLKYVIE
jgi:hypothetical protein